MYKPLHKYTVYNTDSEEKLCVKAINIQVGDCDMFLVQVPTLEHRNINLQFQIGLQILQHSTVVVAIRTLYRIILVRQLCGGLLNTTTRHVHPIPNVTEDREANLARLMLGHLFFFHSSFIPTGPSCPVIVC